MLRDDARSSASEAGAAAESPTGELRVELIENPRELSPERDEQLNNELAGLAALACGGEEDCNDPVVQEGWRNYFATPGGRTQDHDRVVLVYDGDRLVGFHGTVVEQLESGAKVAWWRAAGTDPEYHGRGAFTKAVPVMMAPDWMASIGSTPPSYWLYRTPNPVIYASGRRLWSGWEEHLNPKITADGHAEPIDPKTRQAASEVAAALWPECEFDADNFVVKDFLGEYGRDFWRVPLAESSDPGVNKFFERHIRPGNRDALLVFYAFDTPVG